MCSFFRKEVRLRFGLRREGWVSIVGRGRVSGCSSFIEGIIADGEAEDTA